MSRKLKSEIIPFPKGNLRAGELTIIVGKPRSRKSAFDTYMRIKNQEITKPYRPQLKVDNRPLPYKSITTMALVQRKDIPLYDGDLLCQRNPFWITCCGDTEFGVMKLSRSQWPASQVLEIRHVQPSN